jgi:hypothetical protein
MLKKIPFFLPLLVVFFCLHGMAENYNFLHISDLLVAAVPVTIVMIFFYLFIYFFNRDFILSSFISFYFSVWYLFFGAFQDSLKYVSFFSFMAKYIFLVPFIFVTGFFFTKFIKRNKIKWSQYLYYLNLLLLIYISVDIVQLCVIQLQQKDTKPSVQFDYNKVQNKPDVYFLLFDGYPGNKELKDSFGFDNTRFAEMLQAHEMKILPISSNYDITFYSMSSIFNMRYINDYNLTKEASDKDIGIRLGEIQKAAVFDIFEKMGYLLENNSVFDVKNLPSVSNGNKFLNGGGIFLTDKIFFNRVKKDLFMPFFSNYAKGFKLFEDLSVYKTRKDNENMEMSLFKSLETKESKPVFSYTHLLMPHDPYYFDSLGNKIDFVKFNYAEKRNVSDFISYLKYTNKVIEKMITSIKKLKPNSIIILMSDHGQRGLEQMEIKGQLRLNNICNVYFPNGNYNTPDTITNVNVFRYLFNNQYNQNFPFLKDSAFLPRENY